jgi:hypothetical protein
VRKYLPLMVASQGYPSFRHQILSGFQRQQRSGKAIPKVDNLIDASASYVCNHRFKSSKIAMYVCNKRNSHQSAFLFK